MLIDRTMTNVYNIPPLLQLCAERVASDLIDYDNENKHYIPCLKKLQLPDITIKYIKEDEYYRQCSFKRFIKKKWRSTTSIIPTLPQFQISNNLTITVSSEKTLYFCTISDLGTYMLKVDMPMGDYCLHEYCDGYILKTKDYKPKIEDIIQIFNTRDSNKGLSGTYHNGDSENIHHLRIFNQYISKYMNHDWWKALTYHSYRTLLNGLPSYHNIPVIFYLTRLIQECDLHKINLVGETLMDHSRNLEVCWCVHHSEYGFIGLAVKQKEFWNMMGDQAGIGLLSSNEFRALGNFDIYNYYSDDEVTYPRHKYICEFDPCECDVLYK